MDKDRKEEIERNVSRFFELKGQIRYHQSELDKLTGEFCDVLDSLYQMRPQEYIDDVVVFLKEKKAENVDRDYDDLLNGAEMWLK
jgi:hypothetical protein